MCSPHHFSHLLFCYFIHTSVVSFTMKKELRLLFVLVIIFCSVDGATEPDWFNMPMVVPATQKEGHNYMLPVDVHNNKEIYKMIAVAALNDEILFGEYKEGETCVVFYSPRAGRRICHNRFFLLHRDYVRFYRRYVNNVYLNSTHTYCKNKVEFKLTGSDGKEHVFQPFFDKPGDRASGKALEKFIGTYFVDRDMASYWNHVERKAVDLERVAERQRDDKAHYGDQFEVLCRMKISYKEPNKAPDVTKN